ncbi:MAG: DUF2493 domain-containing protein [Clostridia bacterium]|nr:DUF2493 domain-containing protein [Clostridia bacterium]MBR2327776.1 DUF2493 domain-containing protein [Clostridia bacterium]
MKVAIVGSRNSCEEDYKFLLNEIPANASEIISGGAKGIDKLATRFANERCLKLTEITPDYESAPAARSAPLIRNKEIVDKADMVFAFWDGESKGTAFTVSYCLTSGKPVKVIILKKGSKKPEIMGSTLREGINIGLFTDL